jgi:hypothetical protein
MKNANLLRYPHSSSLRRTSMYASLLGISGALHLDVFDQPAQPIFFTDLLGKKYLKLKSSVTTGM